MADIPVKPIGVSIPQHPTSEIQTEAQLKDFELVVIPIPRGKLGLLGVVLGVEGYSAHPGEMTVYVSVYLVFLSSNYHHVVADLDLATRMCK